MTYYYIIDSLDDKVDGRQNPIHNASNAVPVDISAIGRDGPSSDALCSTPRPVASFSSPSINGRTPPGLKFEVMAGQSVCLILKRIFLSMKIMFFFV